MNEDDPQLSINGSSSQGSYSKGRKIRTDSDKRLPFLVGIALVLIFIVGITYFVSNCTKATDTKGNTKSEETLASRMAVIEQKVSNLEAQLTELQGKSNKGGTDPFLLHQVEALTRRVDALEGRGKQPSVESKANIVPPKPAVASQEKHHTVQTGDTLLKIAKKYGITVEELRKLNNLSKGQSVKVGQKLLVSVKR